MIDTEDTQQVNTPKLEEVLNDIQQIIDDNSISAEDLAIDKYRQLGGKFDGRKLRRLGGFAHIIDAYFGQEGEDSGEYNEIRTELPEAKRYIITAAQNATPVHDKAWAALKVAADYYKAELVAIPLRYKNPTSQWSQAQEHHEWWVDEVKPHLFRGRKHLHKNLVLAADIKTQPTASSPLGGFESLTRSESCIIGHTKMQFRSIPTSKYPKILTTTGSCTEPNFTDTKTGKIGEFHHFLGAIIVEIDGEDFHVRQLNADNEDGSFIDVNKKFSMFGVEDALPALGLDMGDTHERFIDPGVYVATFGTDGIIEATNPLALVYHDVDDNYAVNHHHGHNPFIAYAKMKAGVASAKDEVVSTVRFIEKNSHGREAIVVSSNHNDFLARWIQSADWKTDPVNAEFYLETALALLRTVEFTESGTEYTDAFAYWVNKLKSPASKIRCLGKNESYKLADIECGLHGDRGPNGARGTLKNLSRLGCKVISGHSHTPGIEEGHYQVGTSTRLRLEYNNGPSSWLNTHCIVYANGKRSLITIINGKWRLKD